MATVEIVALELTRGYDGPLRGEPEPVLVLGAYMLSSATPCQLVHREAIRFSPTGAYPMNLGPEHQVKISVMGPVDAEHRLALLVVALEEDSGADVARIFGAMETQDRLSFWLREDEIPTPSSLSHFCVLGAQSDGSVMRSVEVLLDERDLATSCKADDWVGAGLGIIPLAGPKRDVRLRVGLRSRDEKNDWMAALHVRVG